MRLQALAFGQNRRDRRERLRAGFGHMNQAGAFLEVVHPQR